MSRSYIVLLCAVEDFLKIVNAYYIFSHALISRARRPQ